MSAPANDNWANASIISGDYGIVYGTNLEASNEAGEILGSGHSVWYKWDTTSAHNIFSGSIGTSIAKNVFFSTKTYAGTSTDFPTVVRIYSGSALNKLTQSIYYTSGSFNYVERYANWDSASFVILPAHSGSIYYIQVDGLNGATGSFPLSWGQFQGLPQYGSCSACPPQYGYGWTCKGTIQSEALDDTHDFPYIRIMGDKDAGKYVFSYCGGAIKDNSDFYIRGNYFSGEGYFPQYYVSACQDAYIQLCYNSSTGSQTSSICDTSPTGLFSFSYTFPTYGVTWTDTYQGWYWSEAEANYANICTKLVFTHYGGPLYFIQNDTDGNNPNDLFPLPADQPKKLPTWGLYQLEPVWNIDANSICASWITPGHLAQVQVAIANNNNVPWLPVDQITGSLDIAGNVTATSYVYGPTLNANAVTRFAFNFSSSTEDVTTTVRFHSPVFANDVTFNLNLAPIISAKIVNVTKAHPADDSNDGLCNFNYYWLGLVLSNKGYWTVNAGCTSSLDNGLKTFGIKNQQQINFHPPPQFFNIQVADCGNATTNPVKHAPITLNCSDNNYYSTPNWRVESNDYDPITNTNTYAFYVKAPSITTNANCTVNINIDSGKTYGPYVLPFTINP